MNEFNINKFNEKLVDKRIQVIYEFLNMGSADDDVDIKKLRRKQLREIFEQEDFDLEDLQNMKDKIGLDLEINKETKPMDLVDVLIPLDNEVKDGWSEENGDIVVLPAGDKRGPVKKKDNQGSKEILILPKTEILRKFLYENGVDIAHVIKGQTESGAMRKEPYNVIVLPPELDAVILVCDQYGNSTFFIHGNDEQKIQEYLKLTKDKLKTKPDVEELIWGKEDWWKEKILDILTKPVSDKDANNIEDKGKEDLMEDKELIIKKLKEKYTPEEWLNMYFEKKRNFKINNIGVQKLANIFQINQFVYGTRKSWIDIGLAVWPDNEILKKTYESETRTKEKWIKIIKEKYTPEYFLNMTSNERKAFKIEGVGLQKIGSIFGLQESPIANFDNFLQFILVVWPDNNIVNNAKELESRTKEEWIKIIKEQYKPEELLKMSVDEIRKIKIDNIGLLKISTAFNFLDKQYITFEDILKLFLQVWPDNEGLKTAYEAQTRTKEGWRKVFQEKYSPEEWIKMSLEKKLKIKIDGFGYLTLCGMFGIKDIKKNGFIKSIKFGLEIWSDNELLKKTLELENRTVDEWRKIIKEKYTPEDWLEMPIREMRKIKIDDFTLERLGKIFNIKNSRGVSKKAQLEIGLKVWPENKVLKKAYEVELRTKEDWLKIIQEKYTPEEWLNMSNEDRRHFKIDNLGLISFGRIFDVKNLQRGTTLAQLQFGLAIWPDSKILQKAYEVETRTVDIWRELIQQKYTPEEWLGMSVFQRKKFNIDGVGFLALCKKFSVRNAKQNSEIKNIEFGLKIWPDSKLLKDKLVELSE